MKRLRLFFEHSKRPGRAVIILLLAGVLLVACDFPGFGAKAPQATSTAVATVATPTPSIKLGSQPCPSSVSVATHWDTIVPTKPGSNKVESVACGNLIGNTAVQALVLVRSAGPDALLDVYVYSKISEPAPAQLFKLVGLIKGDARISGYNTIMTNEVDTGSRENKGKSNANFSQDLFREFKWSDSAGTLVPIVFPGIFPDMTRFQAEVDQQQVNQGHQPWKLDAKATASALAANLFKWSPDSPATLVSGGGQNDADAVVSVTSTNPGTIQITMSRLEGNTNGGIWIATKVASNGMELTVPATGDRLANPTTVKGKGNAFESVIGTITILDHSLANIGSAQAKGAIGMGNTTFSTNVSYQSRFKGGLQEGLVALLSPSNKGTGVAGAVLVKVLIGA